MTGSARPTLAGMDLDRARFLVSTEAAAALAASNDVAGLALHARADRLRQSFGPSEAAALSEQMDLRVRAVSRWGDVAARWRFTREGLEMATHPLVAARRAARLAALDLPIADLTCGIGGDLAALSAASDRVAGVESDAATAVLARQNAPGAAVVTGDALRAPADVGQSAVLLDPARRFGDLRRFDPAAFVPPWDACLALLEQAKAGAMKGPPGVDLHQVPPSAEVEFVQLGRGLREAAIYVGGDARPGWRRAVLLPSGDELAGEGTGPGIATAPVGDVLYDPASAVTRAGLVQHLALELGAQPIDTRLAYLTGDVAKATPFADVFAVEEVIPFSLARLKKRLRQRGWRPVEIRRRAFPMEPDDLRRQLGRIDGDPVTLLCTTVGGRRLVVVARPIRLESDRNCAGG